MKKILVLLLVSLFVVTNVKATNLIFHGSVKNSIYSYKDIESTTRIYQYARMSLRTWNNRIIINSSLRGLTDTQESLNSEERFKAYVLNLEVKNLLNRIDLTIGRQFRHPGTVLGGLDGIYLKSRILKNLSVHIYGGVETHFQRSFKVYETDDSQIIGGLINLKNIYSTTIQPFYLQKANKNEIFWHLAGINLSNSLLPRTQVRIQAHYDIENEQLHRMLAYARYTVNPQIALRAGFKSQFPQIYVDSFYSIFSPEAYTQYHTGADWEFISDFFINADYKYVQFDDGNANKLYFTFSHLNASVGFLYESGYAGDQTGVVLDYSQEVMNDLIASINLDYSKYRTEEIYEYDNLLANAARLSWHPNRHFMIDIEYQWLSNRFKNNDSRFLNHISFSW